MRLILWFNMVGEVVFYYVFILGFYVNWCIQTSVSASQSFRGYTHGQNNRSNSASRQMSNTYQMGSFLLISQILSLRFFIEYPFYILSPTETCKYPEDLASPLPFTVMAIYSPNLYVPFRVRLEQISFFLITHSPFFLLTNPQFSNFKALDSTLSCCSHLHFPSSLSSFPEILPSGSLSISSILIQS